MYGVVSNDGEVHQALGHYRVCGAEMRAAYTRLQLGYFGSTRDTLIHVCPECGLIKVDPDSKAMKSYFSQKQSSSSSVST